MPNRHITLLTERELTALEAVLAYNWPSEEADYRRAEREGNSREGHIFDELVVLSGLVERAKQVQ